MSIAPSVEKLNAIKGMLVIFVSPELSLGRDLVIQMSVRCGRPPSAFHGFLSGAYLGIPYDLP